MNQSQIDKSIVDILTTMGAKNDWKHEQLQKDIFEKYIKDWLKEVNDECKKNGWKQKEKLVRYDTNGHGGRCFCLIDARSRILLDMGNFGLREYIQKFEENKEAIRQEALQFVAEYPTWTKKYDGIIKEVVDYMRERPAFIEKKSFQYATQVKYHEVELMLSYRNWKLIRRFDLYKKVEDYDVKKICRSLSQGLTSDVIYGLTTFLEKDSKNLLTQKEEDAVIDFVVKNEEYYHVRGILRAKRKLSQTNNDRLNAVAMTLTMLGYDMQVDREVSF